MRESYLNPEHHHQRGIVSELTRPRPTVVAVEGGPCSGKTTLLERLRQSLNERRVVFLPEAATEHILRFQTEGVDIGRLPSDDRPGWLALEKAILNTIQQNIEEARTIYEGTDTVIVTDRCDIGAYVTPEEYSSLLAELEYEMPPMLSHVDQLYYLPSLARIDPSRYERLKSNNPARVEDAQLATEICERNLQAVGRHPELHVAWGGDFELTCQQLVSSIQNPEQEIEKKFLLAGDRGGIEAFVMGGEEVSRSAIKQTYHLLDGNTFRLRETMTQEGELLRSFTLKQGVGVNRREIQRPVDENTYQLLSQCPRIGEPLLKERLVVLRYEMGTRRRAWTCDRYFDRRLPEWTIETDVEDEKEARHLRGTQADLMPTTYSAEQMARNLSAYAVRPVLS